MFTFEPIQNIKSFIHNPLQFMQQQHEQHGDYFSTYLGHKKFHFLKHPGHIQHVLGTEVEYFRKSRLIFNKIKPITGENGLVQLEGKSWQVMRDITSVMFHRKYLDRYTEVINEYADELVVNLKHKTEIDIAATLINYTIKVAVKLFLDIENDADADIIARYFIELNHLCGLRMRSIINFPLIIPTALNRKINHARHEIKRRLFHLISISQQQSGLLGALNAEIEDMPALIYDQLMTFIFAGYETSAASLTFTLYLLAKHVSWQDSIRQSENNTMVQAVYREALRLYPPAYMLAREVSATHYLQKFKLKKGENVILSVREVHRHRDFWHQSDDFVPERFLAVNAIKRHRFSFIPFGYGKRICSGMQLAMIEAEIVISKLLQHFQFSLPDQADLPVTSMVTLHPAKPVILIIEDYHDANNSQS